MSANFESYSAFAEADEDSLMDYRNDEDNFESDDDSFNSDDRESDDDSAEFLGAIANGIGGAIKAVNRIISPTIKGNTRLSIPTPQNIGSAITSGLSTASNLVGQITSATGRQVDFKLPQNTATKADIAILKKAIDNNSNSIRINTAAIKKEAEAIVTLRKEVKEIDLKHITATREQNKIMTTLNRRVGKLRRDLDKTKSDAQMQQMFSMLMQPKLKSITLDAAPTPGTSVNVSSAKFEDNNMFLMLALSGGFGGGEGSNNNSMLPLMFLMNK